ILTTIIWGGTWPLGRWLVSEEVGGTTIPPFMIAVIRYLVSRFYIYHRSLHILFRRSEAF
ncbi:unnamed protein product, partial [marine sediment metagenome]